MQEHSEAQSHIFWGERERESSKACSSDTHDDHVLQTLRAGTTDGCQSSPGRTTGPHLFLLQVLHASDQCEVEAHAKAVLEEEGGATAVELALGDDGDPVAQQVSLVHVVGGQDNCPTWGRGYKLFK